MAHIESTLSAVPKAEIRSVRQPTDHDGAHPHTVYGELAAMVAFLDLRQGDKSAKV